MEQPFDCRCGSLWGCCVGRQLRTAAAACHLRAAAAAGFSSVRLSLMAAYCCRCCCCFGACAVAVLGAGRLLTGQSPHARVRPPWSACPLPSTPTSGCTQTGTCCFLLPASCCVVWTPHTTLHTTLAASVRSTCVRHLCALTAAWKPWQLLLWVFQLLAIAHKQLMPAAHPRLSGAVAAAAGVLQRAAVTPCALLPPLKTADGSRNAPDTTCGCPLPHRGHR